MRFYDIDSGEILINGRNVKSIDAKELKDMFGIAFQNDTIFSDTIKENIVFGRNISDDDLQKAIRVSQAYDFIYNHKEGLETINFSNNSVVSISASLPSSVINLIPLYEEGLCDAVTAIP